MRLGEHITGSMRSVWMFMIISLQIIIKVPKWRKVPNFSGNVPEQQRPEALRRALPLKTLTSLTLELYTKSMLLLKLTNRGARWLKTAGLNSMPSTGQKHRKGGSSDETPRVLYLVVFACNVWSKGKKCQRGNKCLPTLCFITFGSVIWIKLREVRFFEIQRVFVHINSLTL